MTPKEIAEQILAREEYVKNYYPLTGHVQLALLPLAQAYLALESRIQKLESVVDAVRDTRIVSNSIGKMGSPEAMLRAWDRLDRALVELDQP